MALRQLVKLLLQPPVVEAAAEASGDGGGILLRDSQTAGAARRRGDVEHKPGDSRDAHLAEHQAAGPLVDELGADATETFREAQRAWLVKVSDFVELVRERQSS